MYIKIQIFRILKYEVNFENQIENFKVLLQLNMLVLL